MLIFFPNSPHHREFHFPISGTNVSVTVTTSAASVKTWLSTTLSLHRRHRHRLVVGLGVQWTISNSLRGPFIVVDPPADTLQLCVGHRVLIFQLAHADYIPTTLRRFLLHPNNTFVGFWNHSDAKKLLGSRHRLEIWMQPLDLRKYVTAANGCALTMATRERIIQEWLGFEGVRFSVEVSKSEWNSVFLSCSQVEQASQDAFCAFLIGKSIRAWELSRNYDPVDYECIDTLNFWTDEEEAYNEYVEIENAISEENAISVIGESSGQNEGYSDFESIDDLDDSDFGDSDVPPMPYECDGFNLNAKLERHRGDRYGTNHDSHPHRHSRAPSRFSDAPLDHHAPRLSSGGFRSGGSGGAHHRPFDSPPRRSPGRGAGFRPVGGGDGFRSVSGEGPGGFGFNSHQAPPLSGQKRGFPFSGRGGSPDRFDGGSFAKLFVGSVPRTATEEDIRPLFEEHGNVIEVALIKDKKTGQQQGCCFIKYASPEEADRAIRVLHNQHNLPGGVGPIQVRYADGERERLGAVEYKLFVGSLNKQATVNEVEEIFSKYGRVEDVYLMRDEKKQSRGCGFVKYSHRDMALAAINALNGIYTMRGCDQPLTVRFADPKRPRQGDSRGPSFGGPGFGPRHEAPGPRPPSNVTDPMGDRFPPPNAWRPMHPPHMGPSSNAGLHSMRPPLLPRSGDMALSTNAGGPMSGIGSPSDGLFQGQTLSSMSQQNFNHPMPQIPPAGQQISPLQKPIQSPQDLPPSLHMYPPAPLSYSQPLASLRQLGQPQLPRSAGPLPSQQVLGLNGQFPASQPQAQQNASSAVMAQTPLDTGLQSNTALTTPNQQQLSTSMQQPPQQSPSQLAQMLSQQTQTLQASFHSSQKAFSQLQQQLQMMQPSSQGLTLQQNTESMKKQSQWTGAVPQAVASIPAAATAADVPSSASAASAVPAVSQNISPAKSNWTEHISPEGFKYYHNSVTGESRWEKPEELTSSEQQKQQQRPSVQQSQTQSQPPILSAQQVPQMQQLQPQGHFQGQVLHQQQIQQPSYQVYGVTGHQNVQGIYATQEWMWKNKPAGI